MKNGKLDFTDDPYWGKGGSYIVDPLTGKRVPAPAVDEAKPAPDSVAESPAEADPAKSLKEKRRG